MYPFLHQHIEMIPNYSSHHSAIPAIFHLPSSPFWLHHSASSNPYDSIRNIFSEWQGSFNRKLPCHWLKMLASTPVRWILERRDWSVRNDPWTCNWFHLSLINWCWNHAWSHSTNPLRSQRQHRGRISSNRNASEMVVSIKMMHLEFNVWSGTNISHTKLI